MIYDEYRTRIDAIDTEIRDLWHYKPVRPKTGPLDKATPQGLRDYAELLETYERETAEWEALKDKQYAERNRLTAEIESRFAPTYLGEEFAYLHDCIAYPAYEKGHHAGTYEIELKYKDLADLAIQIARATLAHKESAA